MATGYWLLATGSLALLPACGDQSHDTSQDTAAPPGIVTAGDTFAINIGAQVKVSGGDLTITFAAVPEDSRCPEAAECPAAGVAEVQLALTASDGEVQHVMIATGPDSVSRATFRNYTIELLDLNPMPRVGEPSMQRDYTARLLVARTGP